MLTALKYSHELLNHLIHRFPNGNFIDATAGNGHDSFYILSHKQFQGKLFSFDIQAKAIANTQKKIANSAKNNSQNIQLIHDSHANLNKYLDHNLPIHGAIFNLGYLPGGNHAITTLPETTIHATKQILSQLVKRGKIIFVIYSGHSDGLKEKNDLIDTFSQLPQETYEVITYQFINQVNRPPMALIIEKK